MLHDERSFGHIGTLKIMPKLVWFNGELSPLESATVPAADHAHLYGDGLFEGIRIYGRRVFKLDEHLRRLYDGCRFLGIPMKWDQESLKRTILDVCHQSDLEDGYIRLNVTRGAGLGLDPRAVQPDLALAAHALDPPLAEMRMPPAQPAVQPLVGVLGAERDLGHAAHAAPQICAARTPATSATSPSRTDPPT